MDRGSISTTPWESTSRSCGSAGTAWAAQDLKILRGLNSGNGGQPGFQLIALLTFDSVQAFERAVAAHGPEVMGDIPNFTNVQPALQVNDPVG